MTPLLRACEFHQLAGRALHRGRTVFKPTTCDDKPTPSAGLHHTLAAASVLSAHALNSSVENTHTTVLGR